MSTSSHPHDADHSASDEGAPGRQPWLHELSIVVCGSQTVVSATSGDIASGTAQGLYVDGRRVLDRLEVWVGGEPVTAVAERSTGATGSYYGSARSLGEHGADPDLEVLRTRFLGTSVAGGHGSGMTERLTLTSRASVELRTSLRVVVGGDDLDLAAVKAGHLVGAPTAVQLADDVMTFDNAWHVARISQQPPPDTASIEEATGALRTELVIRPGEELVVTVSVDVESTGKAPVGAESGASGVTWESVTLVTDDDGLRSTVAAGLDDLQHLLQRDPRDPRDIFAAAGSPWHLGLFARDALWSARMMLPFGVELALGTLRTLARRQGRRTDHTTGEAPGKIPRSERPPGSLDDLTGAALPALDFGSVDATALWVILLAEAWEWGLAEDRVSDLLPSLEAAVRWLLHDGRPDADGWVKSVDESGRGVSNQGWKNNAEAILWRDGRVAEGPVVLLEVQAYAVEALQRAAHLYRVFDRVGAEVLDAEASALATRIREHFWVQTDAGRHLAMALDGHGRAVDGLGSTMGHVLGTGALTAPEEAQVVEVLMGEELVDAFGIRTIGARNAGFNPAGQHAGAIWTHDTAIIARSLARAGFTNEATHVVRSLVRSAAEFGHRWPETYSGLPLGGRPTPYPAAGRPQAWAAAAVGVVLQVALGLSADVPRDVVRVAPADELPFGPLEVGGLRYAGRPFSVAVRTAGDGERVVVHGLPDQVSPALP